MEKKNTIFEMWPTHFGEFHYSNHKEIKNDLISYFKEYMNNKPSKKNNGENYKLYESEYNLHTLGNPIFDKFVREFLAGAFLAIAKAANKNSPSIPDEKLNIGITESWFINYEKGGFVIPHSHIGGASWSCVYYLQLGKDATVNNGGTYFEKPSPLRTTYDYGSLYNKNLYSQFHPQEGAMLVWPSHIMHGAFPYEGNENKIIISANATISVLENGKSINSF
tara:strand:+ start:89 stop:754 length:666 start_codon:yes stop_codon:yes gene_type:complete